MSERITVLLVTACGCTRETEIPREALSLGWRVPLRVPVSAAAIAPEALTTDAGWIPVRRFVFRGHGAAGGRYIFKEEVKP